MDIFRFRPRQQSPAAYFNNGGFTYWVQADKGQEPHPQLIAAIDAAAREFNRVWFSKPVTGAMPPGLPAVECERANNPRARVFLKR